MKEGECYHFQPNVFLGRREIPLDILGFSLLRNKIVCVNPLRSFLLLLVLLTLTNTTAEVILPPQEMRE